MIKTKIPKRMRLKDNHPTMIKYNKLWELAEELGITINFYGHRTILEDKDFEHPLDLEDIEGDHHLVNSFPYPMEVVLTFDNPEYQEMQRKEREAEEKIRKSELKAQEEARKKQEQEQERIRQEKIKREELAEFKRLQKKYGNVEFVE